MSIRAITLDLDDTLWPIWPTIAKAEQALHQWLECHAPQVAAGYPVDRMRTLRADAFARAQDAGKLHDLRWVRRAQIALAFELAQGPLGLVNAAYRVFEAARQQVEPFPDVLPALARLAGAFPLAAITNGAANLERIGLAPYFKLTVSAAEFGAAKPAASIFLAACDRLGFPAADVLHAGDDPALDVMAARNAGLQAAWVNRTGTPWPHEQPVDLEVTTLGDLAERVI